MQNAKAHVQEVEGHATEDQKKKSEFPTLE